MPMRPAARCTPDASNRFADAMSRLPPFDQAHGLRRLFAHAQTHFVPVVSNPHVGLRWPDARTPVRRLRRARHPHAGRRRCPSRPRRAADEALFELAACIEPLSERIVVPRRARPVDSLCRCDRLDRAVPARRRRGGTDQPGRADPCAGARAVPPVRAPPRRSRRRAGLPAAAGRRPAEQRDPCLRGDEAAGDTRRPARLRARARRQCALAARRRASRCRSRCVPTTFSARCCATGC